MDLPTFRKALDDWLAAHASELVPDHDGRGTLDEAMAQFAKVKRLCHEAGWMRWGWPERVGGLGGSPILRAYLGEALTARDLVNAGGYSMTEVLAPTVIDYARDLLPSTYGVEALTRSFADRPDWLMVGADLGVCAAVGVLSLTAATWAYRRAAAR